MFPSFLRVRTQTVHSLDIHGMPEQDQQQEKGSVAVVASYPGRLHARKNVFPHV